MSPACVHRAIRFVAILRDSQSPGPRNAVVDSAGRVIGVPGLRVVDASIMPTIPRGNTNVPTIMLAEKLSDDILREPTSR